MKTRTLRTRIGRTLAAATFVLGAVPASLAISAAPAFASACDPIPQGSSNGIPNYELFTGCVNAYIPQVHRCQQVVNANGAQAVECADMYFTNSGGSQYIRGVGKFYCQGTYGQCAGMNVTTTMVWQDNGNNVSTMVTPVNYKCNPNPGPACPGNGANGAKLVWTDSGTFTSNAGEPNRCVLGQTILPYDGWSGFGGVWANVMQVKGAAAVHTTQLTSIKANFCFAE